MFFDLFHQHYWGPPRRQTDGSYCMVCCECGKRRKLKVTLEDVPPQLINESAAKSKVSNAA
jgi:hypothetical protein